MLGGSSSDTLDAGRIVTEPDTIRAMALYSGLVRLANSGRDVEMDLAEEVTLERRRQAVDGAAAVRV